MNTDKGFRPKTAPVKVGDEMDVIVEAVGEKGDGIAKREGFVLFIPGAKKGDKVKIRVTKVLRSVGFAEVIGQSSKSKSTEEDSEESEEESDDDSDEESEDEDVDEDVDDSENFGEEEN